MKRNISDLLDGVPVDNIELNENIPLSARRIKMRTMSEIGAKKTHTIHWLPRVALIAALITMMTLTAFAAEDFMKEYIEQKPFESFFTEPLTPKQEEVMDAIGTKPIIDRDENNYGETNRDVTITPIGAIADDTLLYMHLRIEAPKDTVLPDVTGYEYYQLGEASIDSNFGYCDKGSISCRFETLKPLADSDPTDNIKEFVVTVHCSGAMKFNDGVPKKLVFETLWHHKWDRNVTSLHDQKKTCCTKLLDGEFEVAFNIAYEGNKLDLPTEGLTLYNEEFDFTTTVTRLIITPLSVTRDFTFTTPNDKDIFPTGGSVEIVFKDGTSIKVGDCSKYNFGVDAEFHLKSEFEKDTGIKLDDAFAGGHLQLDEPIVLEDIDYIIYAGTHIIDVN